MVLNSQTDRDYLQMARVAVISARENTLLDPVCVAMVTDDSMVAGNFIRWLQSYGVQVIRHRPVWAQMIETHATKGTFDQNVAYSPLYKDVSSLIGTFLRIDLPILGFVDDFILYTDVDVMFVSDVNLDDFGPLPRYYLMCTEEMLGDNRKERSEKNLNFAANYGNAGVILFNMPNMRSTRNRFMKHVFSPENMQRGLHYGRFGPGDQGAYNSFYFPGSKKKFMKLTADVRRSAFFNWR